MNSKIVLALMIVVATVTALPAAGPGPTWPGAGGGNPWIPPWVSAMPWMPQWKLCTAIGSACLDCSTKLVCTKIGGIERACTDPAMPYCNLGECSATPTPECAPPAPQQAVPISV